MYRNGCCRARRPPDGQDIEAGVKMDVILQAKA
jgi:hypothetical protein